MSGNSKDRRQYQRAFLSKDEVLHGVLQLSGKDQTQIRARILNISEGGICIFFERRSEITVKKGDQIQLKKIQGDPSILPDAELTLEVKWIVDNQAFENLELGCEILNPTDKIKKEIRGFVTERM